MSVSLELDDQHLVPVKQAASLVPYTRDHITRLAREGKIVAAQINRQWFIDTVSLTRFYESAQHEEVIRKERLRVARKRELEVAQLHREALAQIDAQMPVQRATSHRQAVAVVVCGLCVGAMIFAVSSQLAPTTKVATVAQAPQFMSAELAPEATHVSSVAGTFEARERSESTRPLSLEGGIVLLPQMASSSTSTVAGFFSDAVEVEMLTDTAGVIRAPQLGTDVEMPFVRVPQGTEAVELTTQ